MGITHLSGLEVAGVPTMGIGGAPMYTGSWYFVDPVNGSDGGTGAANDPFQTVYAGYNACTSGNNDVVVIVGDGATTGTARMSTALAQTINSAATTGTITWAKNATHLIGQTAPTLNARARFAPPTGTYTAATFGNSGNMFNVTGQGCYFANFSVYNGFSTGATGQVAWIEAGGRNTYVGVSFLGMNDTASANSTTSRSLSVRGSGENTFIDCVIGGDTTARTAANASLDFTSGTARNRFYNCTFPFQTSAAGALGVTAAAAGMDRYQLFDRCVFINNVKSTSTTMSALATLAASTGGMLLMKDPTMVGITEFGTDANSLGQIYVDGAAPDAATTGIAVNPS